MNSIFSSFDALCAEFLGQKVRATFPSVTKVDRNSNIQAQRHDDGVLNKATDNVNKKQHGSVRKDQQKTPRFALELDGLNCFETLVSY
ncbi:hypothetical protein RGQ29_010624 [Quercus rubra]|uniref:Uncharacterized protein n=1 Tax=Quercus rubra TaxID=3512 RepID=A0AAN7J7L5_QUERU|nr:hypothetical protein RGQ29_010624 [Quercus rubra]